MGYIEQNGWVGDLVRELEEEFTNGVTQISKYVSFNIHDNIEKVDAYLNSKPTSGEKDSLNRDKPFFNIVTSASNIWYRATDIDRKNIKIKAHSDKSVIPAFLASMHLRNWMKRDKFGIFLNEWGRILSRYGSAVVKFVEKGGKLHAMVIPWNKLIIDPVEFDGNVTIEILELTPSQLRKRKDYDSDIVEKLIDAASSRETMDGDEKDNRPYYIKLYEVHGEMPVSYLTGDTNDSKKYSQQMHVISYIAGKEKGDFDDFTLYSGRESKHPYMITHLIKEDGRSMAIGAVEHLFEAQWMVNHSVKAVKDQLDLASKLIFQTADQNFFAMNALQAIENGDILIHKPNMPLTQVNNSSHDTSAWQTFLGQWKSLGDEIVGASESLRGDNPPSGQAWRLTEALLQESHSLFELMTENKGLYIEEMMRNYVIPFLKTKMDSKDEIVAVLDDTEIAKIDSRYIRNKSNKLARKIIKDKILNEEYPTPEEQMQLTQDIQVGIQENLSELGNQRFFKPSDISSKTWADVLSDLEWEVEVDVTAENDTAKDDLVTLSTVLQTIADPVKRQVLSTPEGKLLFNRILKATNVVSPLEISDMPNIPMGLPPQENAV